MHEFLAMWRDVLRPGPLWQRIKHLWAPPDYERPSSIEPAPAAGSVSPGL